MYRVSKEDCTHEMEQKAAPDFLGHTILCCPLFHFLYSILFFDPVLYYWLHYSSISKDMLTFKWSS